MFNLSQTADAFGAFKCKIVMTKMSYRSLQGNVFVFSKNLQHKK